MIDFIINKFDYDDVKKIIMMYIQIAEFTGNEDFAFTAEALLRGLYEEWKQWL